MTYYLTANVPGHLFPLDMVFTGKREGEKIECLVITPKAGVERVWISRKDIV